MSVAQQALLDSFVAIAAERDEQAVLHATVDVARMATQARYGAAVLVDADGITAMAHAGMTTRQVAALPHHPRGLGVLGAVLAERAPIRLDRLEEHPASIGFPLGHVPMAAFLGVPIAWDGELLGALYLSKPPGEDSFTAEDELLAVALGVQAAQAVITARAMETAARLTDQLAAAEQIKARALSRLSTEMAPNASIDHILAAARDQLGMELSYVARVEDGVQRFEHVSGHLADVPVTAGTEIDADSGYCIHMLGDQLPGALPDTRAHPLAAELPATTLYGVRAYAGVPITAYGTAYGTLCCLSKEPQRGLTEKDLSFLRVLAQLVGEQLIRLEEERAQHRRRIADLRALFARERHTLVVQPIVDIARNEIVGIEALSRFDGSASRPDAVFAEAGAVGLSGELELLALHRALDLLQVLPDGLYLSCNVSPATLTLPEATAVFDRPTGGRIVLELTEHAEVADYGALCAVLAEPRAAGVRIAVDDAGAGFASLKHVVSLRPDIIKIDLALTRGVDTDPARRALTGALVGFAAEQGAALVAEGVETAEELATLRALGVGYAQGYYLGRPAPIGQLLATEQSTKSSGLKARAPR